MLSREWRCSWSNADRRCSNYIWVIDNFIAYGGASYIRGFMVSWPREARRQATRCFEVTEFLDPYHWLTLANNRNKALSPTYQSLIDQILLKGQSPHTLAASLSTWSPPLPLPDNWIISYNLDWSPPPMAPLTSLLRQLGVPYTNDKDLQR